MSLNLLLASTSTIHGKPYLSYYKEAWTAHFAEGSGPVLFVPYARPGGVHMVWTQQVDGVNSVYHGQYYEVETTRDPIETPKSVSNESKKRKKSKR